MSFELTFMLRDYLTNPNIIIIKSLNNTFRNNGLTHHNIIIALKELMKGSELLDRDELYTLHYNGKSFHISHKRPCYNLDIGV